MRWSRTDRTPILLCAIEMDMEALIVTNRLALCTAHPDLNNRGGLELIGHLCIDKKKLKTEKVGCGNWPSGGSEKHVYILSFASSAHGQRRAERSLL